MTTNKIPKKYTTFGVQLYHRQNMPRPNRLSCYYVKQIEAK